MYGKALIVKDLQIEVSICGGIDIVMKQVQPVTVTCIMDGSKITRVHADDGIEFASEGGLLSVEYKPCFDITELCNKAALERQMRDEQREREEMELHTKG